MRWLVPRMAARSSLSERTGGGVAKGLAGSVLLSGALGAFVGAVSDWGDRLCDGPRARQRQAERGAAPDPARDALAERLETMGRQADLAGAADCLAALEDQFRQLTDILTAFVQGRLAPTSPAV